MADSFALEIEHCLATRRLIMAASNVPVRVPERQPETNETSTSRPSSWQREKKPSRFVIKVGGYIPS